MTRCGCEVRYLYHPGAELRDAELDDSACKYAAGVKAIREELAKARLDLTKFRDYDLESLCRIQVEALEFALKALAATEED